MKGGENNGVHTSKEKKRWKYRNRRPCELRVNGKVQEAARLPPGSEGHLSLSRHRSKVRMVLHVKNSGGRNQKMSRYQGRA